MIKIGKFTKDEIVAEFKYPKSENIAAGEFTGDFLNELKIDRINIDDELVQQPSKYVWWSVLAAIAEDEFEQAKLNLLIVESQSDEEIRKIAMDSKIKMTENQIYQTMISMEVWKKAKNKFLEAKKNLGIITAILNAWEQRKYMLVALGGRKKRELEEEMKIQ